jgi:hypothetical protein
MALGTFSGSKGDGTLAAPGPAAKNSAARSALPKTFHVEPSTHIVARTHKEVSALIATANRLAGSRDCALAEDG